MPTKKKPASKPAKKKTAPTKKAPKPMHAIMVLDETGSMMSRVNETISGFNEYVASLQKKAKGDVRMSLMTFNSGQRVTRCVDVPVAEVPKLTRVNYRPNESTPLYDAIGENINMVQENGRDILFIVMTDGEENASKEFNRSQIFEMIEKKKKAGWTFAFLGSDPDVWAQGVLIGVNKGNTMSYQGSPVMAFATLTNASVNYANATTQGRVGYSKNFFQGTKVEDDDTEAS